MQYYQAIWMEQEQRPKQLNIEEFKKVFVEQNKDVAEDILARFLVDSMKKKESEENNKKTN